MLWDPFYCPLYYWVVVGIVLLFHLRYGILFRPWYWEDRCSRYVRVLLLWGSLSLGYDSVKKKCHYTLLRVPGRHIRLLGFRHVAVIFCCDSWKVLRVHTVGVGMNMGFGLMTNMISDTVLFCYDEQTVTWLSFHFLDTPGVHVCVYYACSCVQFRSCCRWPYSAEKQRRAHLILLGRGCSLVWPVVSWVL